MTEFENYMPGAWQVDGLTVGPRPRHVSTQQAASRKNGAKIALSAFVLSMSIVVVNVLILGGSANTIGSFNTTSRAINSAVSTRGLDVPDGYWPRLVSALRAAPPLTDDASANDPEPLY